MANIEDGEDPMDDLIESDDYNVIPRPQELIEIQKRLSSSKSKSTSEKSGSKTSKKSSDSKSKEKKSSSSKQSRKGSSEAKPLYKPPVTEILRKKYPSENKYNARDLDSRFDSFVQSARTSMHRHKSDPPKVSSNELSDVTGQDSKLPDIGVQYSKIMDDPAITPLERFKVLDARDTAMRSIDTKQGDSKKTKIIGTCPDMCPEKERYSRIAKNCLSILEMTNLFDQNVVSRDANHSYMVKEYSRSSADQQQPLPHELRPISVLMFTMDYLICNIMDLPLEYISLADWYDFIWNRTRSIRKDITQQQLCDVQCVEIIEKCVRFHIHCAEALSEEEAATFDPKINNENLTKCLQTLKHMYHDLQSKGIHCQNEAEFRSYDILLSLTEGETLRLIKDIRKDLLRSSEIKFAFNAALAFKSHNYVKFFKLIEKANYLNSCILHRYIPEARARALQIIVRAYSTPHISSLYPLSSLIKDLKFENFAEASEFCRCYGLEVDDAYINIERKQFSKSASGLTPSRSFLLVGSKMGQSLGKVINKGELPANPLNWYKPLNSFDERNILKFTFNSGSGSVEKVEAELPKDNLLSPVTTESSYIKPLPVVCTSSFPNLPAEPKGFFSTSSSFVPPVSSSFSFFNKPIDSFTNAPKEQHLFQSQPVFNSTSFHETSGMKKNDTSIGIGSFQATFNRKTLDLPSTEEFFSFGKKPSIRSETEYPEVETENVAMESNNESSNEAVMMEAEEIDEGSTSPMRENIFSSSSQLNFDRNELQSSRAEESLKELPNSNTSSSHPTPAFEFSRSEIVYSPITEPSPHPTVLEFSRAEIVYSPITKPSIQLEKEFVENEAKEKMSVSDLEVSENSSEGIERGVILINEKERQEQEFNKITEDLVEELCSESIQEYLHPICKEVLEIERHKTAKLKDELDIIRNNLALKTIVKWKFFCDRRRHRRMLEKSTLCSPWQAIFLNTPYIRTGAANPVVVYKKHCLLSKLTEERIKKRKEITPGWEEFDALKIWPLKALRPYPSAYFGNSGFKFFFKLCVVFPSACVSSDISTFMEWICAKFSLHKTQNDKFDAGNTFILHNKRTLVSVRALQLGDHYRTNYVKFLDGITAMILFAPPSLETNEFYEDFTLLLNSDSLQYPYPLFVYFLESQQKVSFHNGKSRFLSFLQEKVDARYFTAFKTECLPGAQNFQQNSNKVSEAVSWFLEEQRKELLHPVLYKCSFVCYIEDSFTFAFNILLCKISLEEFKCLKQMPHHIINFYNKVLKFRSSLLCSDLLERVKSSWPPEETKIHIDDKFIDIETQKKCQKMMTSLHLPSLEDEALNVDNVWNFTKRVAHSAPRDQEMLFIKVKKVLNSTSDDWLSIINICALHIVHTQKLELLLLNEDHSVYYAKEDIESFDCDEFWREVSSDLRSYLILCSSKRKNDSISVSPVKRKKWEMSKEIITSSQIPIEEEITYISNPFDMPDMLSCQRENLFAPLRAALAKQVEQSEAFSHRLNESVQNVDPSSGTQSDDEILENDDISFTRPFDASGTNFYCSSYSPSLSLNTWQNSDVDLLSVSFNDTSKSSFSSLADKISELKYNIKKSNILEDHFSQLLSEQL